MIEGEIKQPPVGIVPRYIWEGIRIKKISAAIHEYNLAGMAYPKEWLEEYFELKEREDERRDKFERG